MPTPEDIVAAFQHLVDEGSQSAVEPDRAHSFRFSTRALNLVRRVCGEDSDHYRDLRRIIENPRHPKHPQSSAYDCVGVIQAAMQDFQAGLLFDLRSLIAAELLGDFLEQAEHLLSAGYHVPAASLAGAVLEDALRKLCARHHVPPPDKPNINKLNVALAKAQVYSSLVQKRITALADVRNNADHGHPDQFTSDDVADMVQYVRRFAADYLG
jgi:hypothetical protein